MGYGLIRPKEIFFFHNTRKYVWCKKQNKTKQTTKNSESPKEPHASHITTTQSTLPPNQQSLASPKQDQDQLIDSYLKTLSAAIKSK